MSTTLSSSPILGSELASSQAVERAIMKMIEDNATITANVTIAGHLSIDFAQDMLARKIIQTGDDIGMSRSEIGKIVGRGKTWAYGVPPVVEPPNIRNLFLDEHIFDIIQSQGRASISELAIKLSSNESDLKPWIAEMIGTYVSVIPGIAPETYEVAKGVNGINHGYPVNPAARFKRMLGGDVIACKTNEQDTYSVSVPLTPSGARHVYTQLRNYSLVLPPEERLSARLEEAKNRGTIASSSRFGAMILFSPNVEYAGAMAHFVECKHRWHDKDYEMVPYRYALDDRAIEQFKSNDFDCLKKAYSLLLREAQDLPGDQSCRQLYRLSLLCAQYAE